MGSGFLGSSHGSMVIHDLDLIESQGFDTMKFFMKKTEPFFLFCCPQKTVYKENIYSASKTHNIITILGNIIITNQLNILLPNSTYSI